MDNDEEGDTLSQVRFLATQPFQDEQGFSSKLMDNLVKDLDAELHFTYYRIAALLAQVPEARKHLRKNVLYLY